MNSDYCSRCGVPLNNDGTYTAVQIKTSLIRNWYANNKEADKELINAYTCEKFLCCKCAREPMKAIIKDDAK